MSEARQGAIYAKMAAIMKSTKAIGKGRKNESQGYMFRGIDAVYNELHEVFADNGVFPLPKVLEMKREERQTAKGGFLMYTVLTIEFTFMADDGSSVSCTVVGEGMDSGDKSCNKASSGAMKYALLQVLLIPTEEKKDSEEDDHDPLTKAQQEKSQCLQMVEQAQTVAELSEIKKKYFTLFSTDKETANAGKLKYDSIMQKQS